MNKRETVDPEIAAWYRKQSDTGDQFRGMSVCNHADAIGKLIHKHGARTLLDYGCGLGRQYTEAGIHLKWGVPMPRLYDPGVTGLERKPDGQFDGVICSDVLEHIPEKMVDAVIAELFDYAGKFVWASVCCRPAKKWFDPQRKTRNLHMTVQPPQWWRARFDAVASADYSLIFTP